MEGRGGEERGAYVVHGVEDGPDEEEDAEDISHVDGFRKGGPVDDGAGSPGR